VVGFLHLYGSPIKKASIVPTEVIEIAGKIFPLNTRFYANFAADTEAARIFDFC
jgi:hypothetical protein